MQSIYQTMGFSAYCTLHKRAIRLSRYGCQTVCDMSAFIPVIDRMVGIPVNYSRPQSQRR